MLSKFTSYSRAQSLSSTFNRKSSHHKNQKKNFRSREKRDNQNKPIYKLLGAAGALTAFFFSLTQFESNPVQVMQLEESRDALLLDKEDQELAMNLFGYNRPSQSQGNVTTVKITLDAPAKNNDKVIKISLDKSKPSFETKITLTGALRSDSSATSTQFSERIDDALIPSGIIEIFDANTVEINKRDIKISLPIVPDPSIGALISELKDIHVLSAEIRGGEQPNHISFEFGCSKDFPFRMVPELQYMPEFAGLLYVLSKELNLSLSFDNVDELTSQLFAKPNVQPMFIEMYKEMSPQTRELLFFMKENFFYIDNVSVQLRNISFELDILNVDVLSYLPTRGEYAANLRK